MPAILAPLLAAVPEAAAGAGAAAGTAAAAGGISATTAIQGIGLAASIAGVGAGIASNAAQADVVKQQKAAEGVRQQQMTLDSMRRKRDIIRQAQIASANSSAISNNQGAGQSSGAEGAIASVQGQANTDTVRTDQNQELGNQMFAINQARSDALLKSSSFGGAAAGLGSLGGLLMKNSDTIARVGGFTS